jgi:hypothetical protein
MSAAIVLLLGAVAVPFGLTAYTAAGSSHEPYVLCHDSIFLQAME